MVAGKFKSPSWPAGLKGGPQTVFGALIILGLVFAFWKAVNGLGTVIGNLFNGDSGTDSCLAADLAETAGTKNAAARAACESSKSGVPWMSIGLAIIGIVVVVSVGYFLYRWYRKSQPEIPEDWKNKWWVTPLCYIGLNLLIFVLFPDKYVGWTASMWFWQMQSGFVIISMMFAALSEGKRRPWLHKAGVVVFLIWIVITTAGWTGDKFETFIEKVKAAGKPSTVSPTGPARTSSRKTRTAWNWENSRGPERDTIMLAFPGNRTAWKIAAAESDFTQFRVDSDGDSTLVRNPNSSAVGIFQIMESLHGRDCGVPGLDIHTTAGNITCAKILMERNPNFWDWDSSAYMWRNGYMEKEAQFEVAVIDPCVPYTSVIGGQFVFTPVKWDTVVTTGDSTFTRWIESEDLTLDWITVNITTSFLVEYVYLDPIERQEKTEEFTVDGNICPELNRLKRSPLRVRFRSLDLEPIMIEVVKSTSRRK